MTTFVTNEAIEWLESSDRNTLIGAGFSQHHSFIGRIFTVKEDHRLEENACGFCKIVNSWEGYRFPADGHVSSPDC